MGVQTQGQTSHKQGSTEDDDPRRRSINISTAANANNNAANRRSFEIIQAAAAAAVAAGTGGSTPIIQMNHRQSFPFIVLAIVVMNLGMFIFTMYANNCPLNAPSAGCSLPFLKRFSFQPLNENPLLGPSASTLLKLGALEAELVTETKQGWRLLSSMWLHAGLFHLFVNMLGLLSIGIRLELAFGFLKIALIYILGGFGGSLISALFIKNNAISVGASGALFGLLGSMVSEFMMNWAVYTNKLLHLSKLLFLVIINLGFGFMPFVDNFAHFGGTVAGFLLGIVLLARPQVPWIERCSYTLPTTPHQLQLLQQQQQHPPTWKHTRRLLHKIVRLIAINLLIAFYAASSALLFKGFDISSKCNACNHLSCIPTSFWTCPSTRSVALF